jgi:hypothetical protein
VTSVAEGWLGSGRLLPARRAGYAATTAGEKVARKIQRPLVSRARCCICLTQTVIHLNQGRYPAGPLWHKSLTQRSSMQAIALYQAGGVENLVYQEVAPRRRGREKYS